MESEQSGVFFFKNLERKYQNQKPRRKHESSRSMIPRSVRRENGKWRWIWSRVDKDSALKGITDSPAETRAMRMEMRGSRIVVWTLKRWRREETWFHTVFVWTAGQNICFLRFFLLSLCFFENKFFFFLVSGLQRERSKWIKRARGGRDEGVRRWSPGGWVTRERDLAAFNS